MNIAQDIKKMVVNREFMWFLLTLMQNAFNQASCVLCLCRHSVESSVLVPPVG